MSPTDFEFTLTIPGDPRLVGAVRLLVAQAAGYGQLSAEGGEQLVSQVEDAAAAAFEAGGAVSAPITFQFVGNASEVGVIISCEAADGSPYTRHIRQRIS